MEKTKQRDVLVSGGQEPGGGLDQVVSHCSASEQSPESRCPILPLPGSASTEPS